MVSHPHRSPGRTLAQALLSLELLVIGGLAVVTALVALYQVVLELAGEHGHFPRGEYFTYGLVGAVLVAGGAALRATRLLQRNEGQALRLLGIVAITFLVLFALSRQRPEMALVSIAVGIICALHIVSAAALYTAIERWFVRAPKRVLHPLAAIVGIVVAGFSMCLGVSVAIGYPEFAEALEADPFSRSRLIRLWAIQALPPLLSLLGYLFALARFGEPGRFLVMLGGLGLLINTWIAFLLHPLSGLILLIPPVVMITIAATMDVQNWSCADRRPGSDSDTGWSSPIEGQGRRHW